MHIAYPPNCPFPLNFSLLLCIFTTMFYTNYKCVSYVDVIMGTCVSHVVAMTCKLDVLSTNLSKGCETCLVGFMTASLGVCKSVIESSNPIIIMHVWLKVLHWLMMRKFYRVRLYKPWLKRLIYFPLVIS